jgi:hypothetical protein
MTTKTAGAPVFTKHYTTGYKPEGRGFETLPGRIISFNLPYPV